MSSMCCTTSVKDAPEQSCHCAPKLALPRNHSQGLLSEPRSPLPPASGSVQTTTTPTAIAPVPTILPPHRPHRMAAGVVWGQNLGTVAAVVSVRTTTTMPAIAPISPILPPRRPHRTAAGVVWGQTLGTIAAVVSVQAIATLSAITPIAPILPPRSPTARQPESFGDRTSERLQRLYRFKR